MGLWTHVPLHLLQWAVCSTAKRCSMSHCRGWSTQLCCRVTPASRLVCTAILPCACIQLQLKINPFYKLSTSMSTLSTPTVRGATARSAPLQISKFQPASQRPGWPSSRQTWPDDSHRHAVETHKSSTARKGPGAK